MSNMQQEAFACYDTYGENVRHKVTTAFDQRAKRSSSNYAVAISFKQEQISSAHSSLGTGLQ